MSQARPAPASPAPRLRRLLDAALDVAVASLALWTLLYCVGLTTQWSLWPSGWVWLVLSLGLLVGRLAVALREGAGPAGEPVDGRYRRPGEPGEQGDGPMAGWLLAAGLTAALVAAAAGLLWSSTTFKVVWVATVLALLALLGRAWLRERSGVRRAAAGGVGARRRVMLYEDLGVLVVMAAVVVATLLIHLADTDDPYYLNRSVWVAEHGNAALRDTMFSPEILNSPYGGGVPIASIEALIGVVAHMTGTVAGTITYLVSAPVAAAAAVWAMWRLVRAWAPRRAFLVFLGSIAFLMLSGDSMLGNFWIVRMWQGKVMAVAFLMPLIWVYLTDVYSAPTLRQRRWATAMLLMSGIAFFGLTPTAVIWGPLMLGAVLLAALLLRSRPLAIGGVAMAAGPILSGLAVVLFSTEVGGREPETLSAYDSFVRILGESTPMVALAILAIALAPLLARAGGPSVLAGCAALAGVLVFAPGILPLANQLTGSGPILWRMLYGVPIAILVGLLLSAPVPVLAGRWERAGRFVPLAAAVVVLLAFIAGGRPIWSHTGHGGPVTVSSTPEWKLDLPALDDVRLLADQGIEGVVLLPPRRMKVLTMYTTDAFPVVPREWFITNMKEPASDRRARRLLYKLASGQGPLPTSKATDRALSALDVTLACVGPSPLRGRAMELLGEAGYTSQSRIGTLFCASPPRSRAAG